MSDTFGEGPPQIAPGHFWRKMDGGQTLRKDERKADRREAPRSPAQPDAAMNLLLEASVLMKHTQPDKKSYMANLCARIDAFLAKASHG